MYDICLLVLFIPFIIIIVYFIVPELYNTIFYTLGNVFLRSELKYVPNNCIFFC